MDLFSISSWSKDVLVHEMTHIYQLSQNLKLDQKLWRFFGPFSYRNALLPTWIIEGSAVLMESLYGDGGRLFSGFVRAFVFSQIQEGNISLKRLLKSYSDPFSSLEKYLHGAYFFAYLHSQYGLQRTKRFFRISGQSVPLDYYGLDFSLKTAFGKNLQTLFQDYKEYYKDLAEKQKVSSAPPLLKSKVHVPLNSDRDSIYFLISDSKSPAELVVFDKRTKQIKRRRVYLPIGKVFKRDGKYVSAASFRTSRSSREYTLVEEGFKPIEEYNSQYVMDFYQDKTISLDTLQNHTHNVLRVGESFYDTIHSSALTDTKGSIFYFKQEAEMRTLYKDKKPLISFKSYFAYPVEADETGLYFIGATQYGSSLFVYSEKSGLSRLSESDRITSAKKINDNEFLVVEITPTHYEYKLISGKSQLDKPFLYQYSFQKENIFNEDELENLKTKKKTYKTYNSLSHLSLQQISLYLYEHFFSSFLFLDPLRFNKFSLMGNIGWHKRQLSLSYFYQKYRPALGISFNYDRSRLDLSKDKYLIETFKEIGFLEDKDIFFPVGSPLKTEAYSRQKTKKKDYIFLKTISLDFSVSYPLLVYPESRWTLTSHFLLGQKEFIKENQRKNYVEHTGQLKYKFERSYNHSYSYHKKREWRVLYHFLKVEGSNSYLNGGMHLSLIEEFGQENFLSLRGEFLLNLWDREPRSFLSNSEDKILIPIREPRPESFTEPFKQSVQNFYQMDMKWLKVINNSYYPLKVPFSLRRFAPLGGLSFLSFQEFDQKHQFFLLPFIGVEFEISAFSDKAVMKLGLALESAFELSKSYKNPTFHGSIWVKV